MRDFAQPRGIDLDDRSLAGRVEGPYRVAGLPESPEKRHAAQAAGPDVSRAADLKCRLRSESSLASSEQLDGWPGRSLRSEERRRAVRQPVVSARFDDWPEIGARGTTVPLADPSRKP